MRVTDQDALFLRTTPTGSPETFRWVLPTNHSLSARSDCRPLSLGKCVLQKVPGRNGNWRTGARGKGRRCAVAACLLDLRLFFQVLFRDARSTEKREKKIAVVAGSFISSEIHLKPHKYCLLFKHLVFLLYSPQSVCWYHSAVGFYVMIVLKWMNECSWLPHRIFTWHGNGLFSKGQIESVYCAKRLPVELLSTIHTSLQIPPHQKRDKCSIHPSLKKRLYYIKLHLLPGPHSLYPSVLLSSLLRLVSLLWIQENKKIACFRRCRCVSEI